MSPARDQLALLDDRADLEASLAAAGSEDETSEYGAVFTKRWVVELILDLVGYTDDRDLASMIAIEPACGHGAFLDPMVERLSAACKRTGQPITDAVDAIRACDLRPANVAASRALVERKLSAGGLQPNKSQKLAENWVQHDDFLLREHQRSVADFVIGNPPYIRLESVTPERSAAYRRVCATMGGRSDVYVGFFEVGLKALKPGGALGFICADRWMRNQYGQRLRQLVGERFSVETTIEMHDVDAFDEEVSAYPSITVLRREPQGAAIVANARATFDERAARRIWLWAQTGDEVPTSDQDFDAARLPGWFSGHSSWPAGSPDRLALVSDLERRLPTLEDGRTLTRVGIGVATGADQVFVTKDSAVAEPDRLLPMAMARDTMSGQLNWSGHYLVNPWDVDTGELARLDRYPRLRNYFETHAASLTRRNIAGRRPAQWYRTIDRVDHSLTGRSKLFLPDIKAAIHPVIDEGHLYPHHNLYYVVSDCWDPHVLGGLLLSRVAQLFIESYAVRMRGGYLRFQAQYLRRIRVPRLDLVNSAAASELTVAFDTRDVERATQAALRLYGIDSIPT